MKVAIYSRKSKFTDKGESIQNQIEMCQDYAKKHFQVEDISIYEDEGFSGGNTDRPQFQKLLADAKKKRFDVLICYRLDRISRNVMDFSNIIELLNDYSIAFVSIREQFDTSTPMGRAMMYISSVFAQLERETIAERIRDNMRRLARSGRWLGGITPTGFESKSVEYLDDQMNKKKMQILSPIASELDLVHLIYSKYIELDSLSQLESYFLEQRIKSKNGKYFDKTALKSILSNPVYAVADPYMYEFFTERGADIASDSKDFNGKHGIMCFNKHEEKKNRFFRRDISEWIVAVGAHKGVIVSHEWIKVHNMLKKNREKAPRDGSSKLALLTPLLVCGNCGTKMRLNVRSKESGLKDRHYYYKCRLKETSRGSHCNIKNLNGAQTDQLVIDELKRLSLESSDFYQSLEKQKTGIEKTTKREMNDKKRLEKELSQCEEQIGNLTVQLSQNASSAAAKYIIQQIENLDHQIAEIRKKLRLIDSNQESSLLQKLNAEIIQQLLRDFAEQIDHLDFDEKKKYIGQLVESIVWDGENLQINIRGNK